MAGPFSMIMQASEEHPHRLLHSALIIGSQEELLAALPAEIHRSAGSYDEVLMVVGEQTRAVLAPCLGTLNGVLSWADTTAFYQRLGLAYERFRRYLAEQRDAGRRVHLIAEPDIAGGMDAALHADRAAAYLAYEAMCNDTYAPYHSAVTCLWSEHRHSAAVLDGVRATHSHLLTPAGLAPSPCYRTPERYLTEQPQAPLLPAPAHTDHDIELTDVTQLRRLRSVMNAWAAAHRFAEEPADDLVVAVVEVAANGLRHGTAPVRVRAWHHHDTLVVQCDDPGGHPVPATAGYRRPGSADATPGGRGLWLARQLADMVQIDSTSGHTRVRLHFPYQVMH
ncbi:ATP-binding protein [Couchioplanes azureus]|uniref:ATP-binding protein n=1 Tax=Couchioplanes caeruleus TaxID=56438 RepID=UPI001670F9EF|nr:ATP-binding protein [Couchioplanes caeruleus]GGQ71638.1 hypothetical protein GCM10010166_47220 [Couchioplanes caeruleus subsp. azureus]